jgi:hypothetical protein
MPQSGCSHQAATGAERTLKGLVSEWRLPGANSALPARSGTIRSIVYLDAFYAPSGTSVADCTPELATQFYTADPVPFPFHGQTGDPELERLVTSQPLSSLTTRPTLSGARDRVPTRTYVLATALPMPWFVAMAMRLKEDPSWRYRELPCGHGTMREMPLQTAEILLEAVV